MLAVDWFLDRLQTMCNVTGPPTHTEAHTQTDIARQHMHKACTKHEQSVHKTHTKHSQNTHTKATQWELICSSSFGGGYRQTDLLSFSPLPLFFFPSSPARTCSTRALTHALAGREEQVCALTACTVLRPTGGFYSSHKHGNGLPALIVLSDPDDRSPAVCPQRKLWTINSILSLIAAMHGCDLAELSWECSQKCSMFILVFGREQKQNQQTPVLHGLDRDHGLVHYTIVQMWPSM